MHCNWPQFSWVKEVKNTDLCSMRSDSVFWQNCCMERTDIVFIFCVLFILTHRWTLCFFILQASHHIHQYWQLTVDPEHDWKYISRVTQLVLCTWMTIHLWDKWRTIWLIVVLCELQSIPDKRWGSIWCHLYVLYPKSIQFVHHNNAKYWELHAHIPIKVKQPWSYGRLTIYYELLIYHFPIEIK